MSRSTQSKIGFIAGLAFAIGAAVLAYVLLKPKAPAAAPATTVAGQSSVGTPETMPPPEATAALPDHPPIDGMMGGMTGGMTGAMTGSEGAAFSGTIALDDSIRDSIGSTVTVFIIARTGEGKGHPVYAKRLDLSKFPAEFSLGDNDSMSGGPPPASVSLEARIDLDGDAMTREPHAPSARLASVQLGATDVKLTLKPGA